MALPKRCPNGVQNEKQRPRPNLGKMTLAILDILNMLLIISSITDLESEKVERGEGEAASNILGGFASFASNILVCMIMMTAMMVILKGRLI